MAKSEKKVSALETLVGTQALQGSMQRDLLEGAESIAEQLEACSTILNRQGRRTYDDQEISGYMLQGIGDVLAELAECAKQMKGTIKQLSEQPKLIVPTATVRFQHARRTK